MSTSILPNIVNETFDFAAGRRRKLVFLFVRVQQPQTTQQVKIFDINLQNLNLNTMYVLQMHTLRALWRHLQGINIK